MKLIFLKIKHIHIATKKENVLKSNIVCILLIFRTSKIKHPYEQNGQIVIKKY